MTKASPEIVTATLSPGGLTNDKPSVYIIRISNAKKVACYVGRTGTSNGTGTSSPFKRLGTHLAKRGKTKSAFWGNDGTLEERWFEKATIHYYAVHVQSTEASDSEKWLMAQLPELKLLNNTRHKTPSGISTRLKSKLGHLLARVVCPR